MLQKDFNFDAFKANAIKNQPLTRQIKLSEIEFTLSGDISYRGMNFPLTKSAMSDLYKILGFGATLDTNISKTFTPELRQKVANIIKLAKSGRNDVDMQIVVSAENRRIERVFSSTMIVNVNSFFTTFERIVNDSNLDLKDAAFNAATGDISLSCVSADGEFQVGKMANEIFHPGVQFSTSLQKGVALNTYIERLVCSNGMVRKTKESEMLLGITAQENSLFFERLELLRKGNFAPINFVESVIRAQNVNASFGELEDAAKLIKSAIRKGQENVDDFMVSNFVPYAETINAFKAKGLDVKKLNDAQKANAVTNVKVWDVVNGLTDFASHDYGFEVPESTMLKMQVQAGGMFDKKSFDTENLVTVSLV